MKYKNYNTKTMSDSLLWQAVLSPIEKQMPEELKLFLNECTKEFSKRSGIKSVPIMNCKK